MLTCSAAGTEEPYGTAHPVILHFLYSCRPLRHVRVFIQTLNLQETIYKIIMIFSNFTMTSLSFWLCSETVKYHFTVSCRYSDVVNNQPLCWRSALYQHNGWIKIAHALASAQRSRQLSQRPSLDPNGNANLQNGLPSIQRSFKI